MIGLVGRGCPPVVVTVVAPITAVVCEAGVLDVVSAPGGAVICAAGCGVWMVIYTGADCTDWPAPAFAALAALAASTNGVAGHVPDASYCFTDLTQSARGRTCAGQLG